VSAISIIRYNSARGKQSATIAMTSDVVRICRRYQPEVTLWRTTVGGPSTGSIHIVAFSASMAAATKLNTSVASDADMIAIMSSQQVESPNLASPPEVTLSAGVRGFDTAIEPQTGGERAILLYTTAVHADLIESQTRVHALSARHGLQHSALVRSIGGAGPQVLIAAHLASSTEALGAALDSMAIDPEYAAITAKWGQHRLGTSILREVAVN
jgi:hypothetical protein